jgi:hypothetical protein
VGARAFNRGVHLSGKSSTAQLRPPSISRYASGWLRRLYMCLSLRSTTHNAMYQTQLLMEESLNWYPERVASGASQRSGTRTKREVLFGMLEGRAKT